MNKARQEHGGDSPEDKAAYLRAAAKSGGLGLTELPIGLAKLAGGITEMASASVLARPAWVTNAGSFANWMKNLEAERPSLTVNQVDSLVDEARMYGVQVSATPSDLAGHPGIDWDVSHIHFGVQRFHIEVPVGYQLPP